MRAAQVRLIVLAAATGLALIAFAGCGRPFKIKTSVRLPDAGPSAQAQAGGLTLQATAITDEDVLYDVFDANLVRAGILPVRVRVSNGSGEPVALSALRFELQPLAGGKASRLDARRAYKRLISYYDVSAYNIAGNRESRADFESHELQTGQPLAAGETREGLIFFVFGETRAPAAAAKDSTLRISGGRFGKGKPVELKLTSER
jgi:hypothetical protein